MSLDPIHSFYCSKDYLTLARSCKIKSNGVCSNCGDIFDIDNLRPHHKIELTLDNIDDPKITLNPENIEVLCHTCHNLKHRRFCNAIGVKHVYLVYGSPFSGKHAYVETVATRDDIIVDLEKIHKAICVSTEYDKPDATKKVAFTIRDLLLLEVFTAGKTRKWQNAYVIGTYPSLYDRERFIEEYSAELIHIDTPQEECIRRASEKIIKPQILATVKSWIEEYFKKFNS